MWTDYREVKESPASVVCLGNFDGLHRGHQSIFAKTLASAKRRQLKSYVMTFDPHPAQVLGRDKDFQLILSNEEKIHFLKMFPFDGLLIQKFDRSFSEMPAEDFIERVLVKALNARVILVGKNFRFGYQAKGNVELLKNLAVMEVEPGELVADGAKVVSSSAIRSSLSRGDLSEAKSLLGYSYFASGVVVHGAGRGTKIGVPTANILLSKALLLSPGVYGGIVENLTTGEIWKAALNFGRRPTFDNGGLALEAHLLDFKGDLYGRTLRIHFESLIRSEKKFHNVDELILQVKHDIEVATDSVLLKNFQRPEEKIQLNIEGVI